MIGGLAARLRGSRFVRDSAVLQLAAVVSGVASLVSALGLAFVLGPVAQGEFYLAVATWSFLWFFVSLGLYNVTASQVAAAIARGNEAKVGSWVAWLAKASFVIGLGATLLGQLLLPAFAQWAYDAPVVGRAAAILALTPLLELPRVVLNAALQGARRMSALAAVENGQELTRVFLVVMGAAATGDAVGPAIGMVGASLVGALLSIDAYVRESRRPGVLLPSLGSVAGRLREVPLALGLRLGLRVGLMRNVDAYGVQILPPMVLGIFGDRAWVAYLRLAQRFVGVARLLMSGIARTALSHFSGLVGTRDHAALEPAYWRATLGSGLLMTLALLGSLPLVPLVIAYFPAAYHEPVWLCYQILVPGVIIVSFSVANDTFYLVTNTLRVAVIIQFAGLFVGLSAIVLCSWLWPTFGTALGMSINFCLSLAHVAYAAFWFRRRRRESEPPAGEGRAPSPPPSEGATSAGASS